MKKLLVLVVVSAVFSSVCHGSPSHLGETNFRVPKDKSEIMEMLKDDERFFDNHQVVKLLEGLGADSSIGQLKVAELLHRKEFSLDECTQSNHRNREALCRTVDIASVQRVCNQVAEKLLEFCTANSDKVWRNWYSGDRVKETNELISKLENSRKIFDDFVKSKRLTENDLKSNIISYWKKCPAAGLRDNIFSCLPHIIATDKTLLGIGPSSMELRMQLATGRPVAELTGWCRVVTDVLGMNKPARRA